VAVGAALALWLEAGVPTVEPQALAAMDTNTTMVINGAGFAQLTSSVSTAERELGF
jgi:hypothetical protein